MADGAGRPDGDFSFDDVSLESILAEYKGTAYINGDKRTPTQILNEQTDNILREALGNGMTETDGYPEGAAAAEDSARYTHSEQSANKAPASVTGTPSSTGASTGAPESPGATEETQGEHSAQNAKVTYLNVPLSRAKAEARAGDKTAGKNAPDENTDSVLLFFENYHSPEPDTEQHDALIRDVEKAVEKEMGYDGGQPEPMQLDFSVVERSGIEENEYIDDEEEDEIFEEPELKDALKRFAAASASISLRSIPAAVVTLIMIILTMASEAGMVIPFGIGRSQIVITGVLIVLQLIVMMLCPDLVIRGAGDLLRGAPNAETLILFSCAFSIISGAFTMLTEALSVLPYCAVSAISLTLAAFGERFSLRAITETLKTAVVSSEPYGLQAEYNKDIDKSILKKAYNRTDGFYNNLIHPDVSETAYRYAAPILLSSALVLAVVLVVVRGMGEHFLHVLSAMLAAAAPFSAMLAFSLPFGIVVKAIRKSGAALAGWGGVDDIYYTDGASVTDDDLFPTGTLSFNGVKMYDGTPPETAIKYTASLIMASGSGLSRLFYEVMQMQKLEAIRVEDFACSEGGIGARINKDKVATGSAAFMNLLGIRVPDDTNLKNAVFTAINGKLSAMFAIEYLPVNSVQGALISMLKWRIKLFFAMRDFNITPLMLEQKFRVSLDGIEYMQAKDSYSISDSYSGRQGKMAALLAREGLGPFAEAITGSRLLKSAALAATIVSVISAALGLIFMFYICWHGSFLSAKPGNLMLFMLSALAAVLIVCGYVKCRK